MSILLAEAIQDAMKTWTPEQRDQWEERAAIIEEGDKLPREKAEAAAFFELRKAFKQ